MKQSVVARKFALGAVLAMLLGTLVVPAAPAAADPSDDYWSLSASPVAFKAGGQTYRMSMWASEYGVSENLSISISHTRDPKGVARSTQTVSWDFPLSYAKNRFKHTDAVKLTSASLDTGNDMGIYGRVQLKFAQDGKLRKRCDGHERSRAGTLSSTVTFKTQTGKLETVKAKPVRAVLNFSDGEGGLSCWGGGGSNACPPVSRSLSAGRFSNKRWNFDAIKSADGKRVDLWATKDSEKLKNGEGDRYYSMSAVLPGKRMGVNDKVGAGFIKGVKGLPISGSASYTADSTDSSDWRNCGGDKKTRSLSSQGQISGDFKVTWWLGGSPGMAKAPAEYAGAWRTIVRLR